jgi:hypothetical protein
MSINKLLVVLDFNGTILDSTHQKRTGVTEDAMARFKFVYFRPGMRQFIDWLMSQSNVEVALWTSNIYRNAQALTDIVFTKEQQRNLAFTLSRSHCIVYPDYSSQKPMQLIVQKGYQPENVIVVDDSPEKILMSSPPIDYYHISTFEASPIAVIVNNDLEKLQHYIASRLDKINKV